MCYITYVMMNVWYFQECHIDNDNNNSNINRRISSDDSDNYTNEYIYMECW